MQQHITDSFEKLRSDIRKRHIIDEAHASWSAYTTEIRVKMEVYKAKLTTLTDPNREASPESFIRLCNSETHSPLAMVSYLDVKFHESCKSHTQISVHHHREIDIIFNTIKLKLSKQLEKDEEKNWKKEVSAFITQIFSEKTDVTYIRNKIIMELNKVDSFENVNEGMNHLQIIARDLGHLTLLDCNFKTFFAYFEYKRDPIMKLVNVVRLDLAKILQLAGICGGYMYSNDSKQERNYIDEVTQIAESIANFLTDGYIDALLEKYWSTTVRTMTYHYFSQPFETYNTYNTSSEGLRNILDQYGHWNYKHQIYAFKRLNGEEMKVFNMIQCLPEFCKTIYYPHSIVIVSRFNYDDLDMDELQKSNEWIRQYEKQIRQKLDDSEYDTDNLVKSVKNIEESIKGTFANSNFSTIGVVRNWGFIANELELIFGYSGHEMEMHAIRQIYYFTYGMNRVFGMCEKFIFFFIL
jgi:hypothetical protein